MSKKKLKLDLRVLAPLSILVLVVVLFTILTKGALLSAYNLQNILNQTIPTIIAGMGMIFVISMGGTDISHGSLVALSGGLAVIAATKLSSALLFPVAILVGAASGTFVGFVNTKFKVPSFMITLSMNIALRALVNVIIGAQTFQMPKSSRVLINSIPFKLIAIIVLLVIITYIFNYTRFGLYVKSIGENENAVRYAGIKVNKVKIFAFVISGIMASIAGIFTVARVGGVNNTLASSFEMRIMMALFVAGVPVKGGLESKLYKLFIGAPLITILESGMVLCGVSGSLTQAVRGLVLICAVYLTRYMSNNFSEINDKNNILDSNEAVAE